VTTLIPKFAPLTEPLRRCERSIGGLGIEDDDTLLEQALESVPCNWIWIPVEEELGRKAFHLGRAV
jgi:hypothetical protein